MMINNVDLRRCARHLSLPGEVAVSAAGEGAHDNHNSPPSPSEVPLPCLQLDLPRCAGRGDMQASQQVAP